MESESLEKCPEIWLFKKGGPDAWNEKALVEQFLLEIEVKEEKNLLCNLKRKTPGKAGFKERDSIDFSGRMISHLMT